MNKLKINPKYIPLYNSDCRYYITIGGRASGKSFSIAVWLISLLKTEKNHHILYTRLTMISANISIIPELVEKIELMGLTSQFQITKNSIINTITGSKVTFMGLRTSNGDNTARLKSIANLTTLIVEEAEELLDEKLFDKVNLSIRTTIKQNRVVLILNPATKSHWIYKRFFEKKSIPEGFNGIDGNTCYIHTTYKDNYRNLSKDFIHEISVMAQEIPEKYNHIVMGGWLNKSEGVIFENWEYGEFNDENDYFYGADWGYSIDPSTLVKVSIDKKNRKIYLKEELYQIGLSTSKLAGIFKIKCKDKLIVADSAEGRLIDEIKANDVNIKRCTKGAGSVKEGIMIMKDYQLIIDPSSLNLANELNNYSWKDDDTPIDKFNHLIDAARYIISDKLKRGGGIYHIF